MVEVNVSKQLKAVSFKQDMTPTLPMMKKKTSAGPMDSADSPVSRVGEGSKGRRVHFTSNAK